MRRGLVATSCRQRAMDSQTDASALGLSFPLSRKAADKRAEPCIRPHMSVPVLARVVTSLWGLGLGAWGGGGKRM
eukprot:11879418-Alexandrium_andersonii.AAC.1